MQRAIIAASFIGSFIIIGSSTHFFDDLLLFLVVGAIPGTSYTVSPSLMSLFITVIMASILAYYATTLLFEKRTSLTKSKLPKRRYSQL